MNKMASKTLTISGTLSGYVAEGGPTAAIYIGSPVITPSSTTGDTLTYTESNVYNMTIVQGDGAVAIAFNKIADADLIYIGTDYAAEIVINSGTFTFGSTGGYILIKAASITAATVEATSSNDTQVTVAIYGA